MDVAIDGSFQQLVLDARIDLEHLRVVFEHLVEIVFGIELPDPFHSQHSAHEELSGRFGISSKIAHNSLL